jgi:hypothetical protein
MSVSTEVQRTLVKSPPELWAELSCAEALARHLGDFGEIRITAVEPETKVEWEADAACGVVQLEQSGWGTRVTLSVTRDPPAPDVPSEPEPEPVAFVEAEPEPAAEEAEPPTVAIEPPTAEPEVADSEPEADAHVVMAAVELDTVIEPEPELGFFARLFRKRKAKPAIVAEPEPVVSMEPEPAPEPEVVAMAAPEPIYPAPPPAPETVEPAADLGAELESVEAQMEQEAAELLTGVLDRLGAAHHRPFSRG